MATSIYDMLGIIADLDTELASSDIDRKQSILSHLQRVDKLNFRVPDFKKGLEWLNVAKPLSLSEHLKGRIVILDFFTYCCINCVHILPDLEAVEKRFPSHSGVVVVGVHSAKFLNEKVTANILSAILRLNIHHPVVNDENVELWQALLVSCWPTLVFVGPAGQLIYSLAGEGHRAWILEFLQVAADYYSSELCLDQIPLSLEKDKTPVSKLNFPGKVCYWPDKKWLVIADTGSHRIVVTDMAGVVQIVIGSGSSGLKDGDLLFAEFSSPQGVACHNNCIYVADTGNHCLRKIDLGLKTVRSIVGTGHQGTDKEGGLRGTDQQIASPWDVVLGTSPDEGSSPVLFVAMAGTHQIWVYFLTDCSWYRDRFHKADTCIRFAGSGQEENRNNSYPEKASFAQPSGLALSSRDSNRRLYVADSESSCIRAISLLNCAVTGLVGGEKDPTNLFAYGDVDAKGINAKLQHPLGVAFLDGKLVVADSYNHKIKLVDLETMICKTYAGTGFPGSAIDKSHLRKCEFNEPGGVSVDETSGLIYVADTNNHTIKVINHAQNEIFQLPIVFAEGTSKASTSGGTFSQLPEGGHENATVGEMISLPDVNLPLNSHTVTLDVPLNFVEGTHINTEAPNSWTLCGLDAESQQTLKSLPLSDLNGKLHSIITSTDSSMGHASLILNLPQITKPVVFTIKVTVQIFLCLDKDNACLPPKLKHFKQVLRLMAF